MIRAFTPTDLAELERLHQLYFKDKYELPDFMNMLCAFVVEDDKGVILFGGVRDIPETMAVTNMDRTVKDRGKALYQLLDASTFVCRNNGYDRMYIWTQDERYANRLRKTGFRNHDGESLILDL